MLHLDSLNPIKLRELSSAVRSLFSLDVAWLARITGILRGCTIAVAAVVDAALVLGPRDVAAVLG